MKTIQARINDRGEIEPLEKLDLPPGTQLVIQIVESESQVKKSPQFTRLAGYLKYEGPTVTLEDMDRAISDPDLHL